MKSFHIIQLAAALLFSMAVSAQYLTIEERNEQIRHRWNQSLVDDSEYRFNKQPNLLLVNTVKTVEPGRALVVAMGQGRYGLDRQKLIYMVLSEK